MTNLASKRETAKTSFWNQLENKKITNRQEIENYLCQKLGTPNSQLSFNCLTELTKKITSYYTEGLPKNFTIYSLVGSLTSPEQIIERKFKEGKKMGQSYYILKVGEEKLQATEEELEPSKWQQITKLAITGQELVFKYRKFYNNKQLLDFLAMEKDGEGLNGIERNKDSKR